MSKYEGLEGKVLLGMVASDIYVAELSLEFYNGHHLYSAERKTFEEEVINKLLDVTYQSQLLEEK